jgi:hypothetical protein
MIVGQTQISGRNLLGGKVRPEHKVHNLNAIYELIPYTMWERQYLKNLYVSTACYGDSFKFLYLDIVRTSQETYI